MKKVALLFTILCAGMLNSMEPERNILAGTWENLPNEVKSLIITAITQSGNNLNEAIKHIVRFSRVNKELNSNLNNRQGFTEIVHVLADQFNSTTEDVAMKFSTPFSKAYLNLAEELKSAVSSSDINKVVQLIKQGADVNYRHSISNEEYERDLVYYNIGTSLLTTALSVGNAEMIKLLLDNGADPNLKDMYGNTAFEWIEVSTSINSASWNHEEIKPLLEKYKK